MRYETSTTIDASPDDVWQALANVHEWPQWTASMEEVDVLDGSLGAGARVRVRQPKIRELVYTVDGWEPGVGFSWAARAAGIRIAATHTITSLGEQQQQLTLAVDLRVGPSPLLTWLLGRRLRRYVDMEADGLRRYAEQLRAGR